MPSPARQVFSRWLPAVVALGLLGLTWCLRAPSMGFLTWNVDEAIHAAVARTLLDGGVLYRDAIDQRTPLTYVAVAGVFRLAGVNNFFALHALLAVMVAGTAWLLFLTARRLAGMAAGIGSALAYAILSTALFQVGDANALVTEWFVALFSSAAAWCMLGDPESRLRRVLGGGMLGLGVLSKQPALLEIAAPLGLLAWLAFHRRATTSPTRWLQAGVDVLVGFISPLLLVGIYYASRGALGDFVYYAWTYNLTIYGPEIGGEQRIASLAKLPALLASVGWAVLALACFAVGRLASGLSQRLPSPEMARQHPARLYVLIWLAAGLAGAASGGRAFDHYFIQALPALSIALGWAAGALWTSVWSRSSPLAVRAVALLWILALVAELAPAAYRARARTQPVDPSWQVGQFIAEHSRETDGIFVWGYHPDLYVFSGRKPASRFVYASFLTGLVPWTNVAPDRDTTYAIVPGAMETLLSELAHARPAFIVDCSAGPNRHWAKYPPGRFPELSQFLAEHYTPVEAERFITQGFKLYARKERPQAARPTEPTAPPSRALTVQLIDLGHEGWVRIVAHDPEGRLQRIGLCSDSREWDAIELPAGRGIAVDFQVSAARSGKEFAGFATTADGLQALSLPARPDATAASRLTASQLAEFPLPLARHRIAAREGTAPFGARRMEQDGATLYFAHAPSRLQFALPPEATQVRGRYGFVPGAYAEQNATPTDGAEFVVSVRTAGRPPTVLHRHSLSPTRQPADRAGGAFQIALPPGQERELCLEILPGPAGSATSDWTYWADLLLETSY